MIGKSRENYRVLLLAWYGHNAIGDDVIAEVIKRLFIQEAEKRGIRLQFASPAVVKDFRLRTIHSYLINNDLIVIGGGSILGFDTMNLYMTLFGFDGLDLHRVSRNRRTPLVIFGGGFRSERDELPERDRIHMKRLFDRAALKGVRGPVSRQLLISNGIVDEVEIIGDPALSFDPVLLDAERVDAFNIGMNVRFMKGREPRYVTNDEVCRIFAQLADHFVEEGAQIHFFSFTENAHDSDTAAARKVVGLMKHKDKPQLIPFSNDTLRMCSLIGTFDYLVCQRLHPCLLGWVQRVPNIAFEYQFLKTADFMTSIAMDEFTIRMDEFSLAAYLERYKILEQARQSITRQSQELIEQWRARQRKFVNECLDIMLENRER